MKNGILGNDIFIPLNVVDGSTIMPNGDFEFEMIRRGGRNYILYYPDASAGAYNENGQILETWPTDRPITGTYNRSSGFSAPGGYFAGMEETTSNTYKACVLPTGNIGAFSMYKAPFDFIGPITAGTIGEHAFEGSDIQGVMVSNRSDNENNSRTWQDGAFYECTKLKYAIMDSTRIIPEVTFYGCSSLRYVDWYRCHAIGTSAFKNCSKLETVHFDDMVTLYASAFEGCSSLSNINFGITAVFGGSQFKNCKHLTNEDVESLLSSIITFSSTNGVGMFENCTFLTHVKWNKDNTLIPDNIFKGCSRLTLTIPSDFFTNNSVDNVSTTAFDGIKLLRVPSTVSSEWKTRFTNCTNVTVEYY